MYETKYITAYYDEDSRKYLKKFCIDNGLDLTVSHSGNEKDPDDFDFHVTIFFSTSEHDAIDFEATIDIQDLEFVQYSLFGPDNNILVMEVDSAQIRYIRQELEGIGVKDAWPEYKPHTTLSYNSSKDFDIDTLPIPDVNSLRIDKLAMTAAKK